MRHRWSFDYIDWGNGFDSGFKNWRDNNSKKNIKLYLDKKKYFHFELGTRRGLRQY